MKGGPYAGHRLNKRDLEKLIRKKVKKALEAEARQVQWYLCAAVANGKVGDLELTSDELEVRDFTNSHQRCSNEVYVINEKKKSIWRL